MPLLLTVVFVLSGAAGLIYESIWSRYLGLFVGHSAYGQVIVLVIYLGGMSAGAALAARRSERIREPLVAYAIVEVLVGLIGLVFHDLFLATTDFAYHTIFPAVAGGALLPILKWALASALILPQSLLLGATFPLMTAGLIRQARGSGVGTGRLISLLYFANSIGAAGGVLLAGFYLIGSTGLPGTLLTAAIINILVGLVVFGAVRITRDEEADSGFTTDNIESAALSVEPDPELPMLWRVLLIVSLGTALSSFIYEISWVRMLSLVLGSATHSFELMLSAFILGLALGAFWVRTRADGFRDAMRTLAVTQWAMGALALGTLTAYLASFHWMATLISGLDQTVEGYHFFTLAKYGIALTVMLPATFCAGITLPLITHMLMRAGGGERAIGAVYSVNTLGSIVGAALAALVLLPMLGLKTLLILGGAIDMAIGVWLMFLAGRTNAETRRFASALTGATVLVVFSIIANVPFDRTILISGVFRYGRVPQPGSRDVVFYKDGRTATVSVVKAEDGGYSLATNGKPDASLSPRWFQSPSEKVDRVQLDGDESTQVLLPMITLAHVPKARQGAVIGNGSGMSSHLLLGSPTLEKLVTIDIEPEMINGSHMFYPVNKRVFDDPRAQYVHDDAKSYFASQNRKFDLILSEPSNPWVSGVSGLFTDEFYQRVRSFLTPDGIFGQWLHLYEIDDGLVLSVIRAVHKNFPSYNIFLTADLDILIVASNKATLPTPDWSVFQLPGIEHDLRHFYPLTPTALESTRLVSRAALEPMMDGKDEVGANSDFYPTLDLRSEQTRYMKEHAYGFQGLNEGRYDIGAALAGERILPNTATTSVLDIGRVNALALGAALRVPAGSVVPLGAAEPSALREARSRLSQLQAVMATGHAPPDWPIFFRLACEVESDLHSGTMGWADEPFYASVSAYMERQNAPRDARDAWQFLRAISVYDWPTAAALAPAQVDARTSGRGWLGADLLRGGAVIAYMRTGDFLKARDAFDRLAEFARWKNTDLRIRLLGAHLAAAEKTANVKPSAR
jgi:spermidine synthase